MTGTDTVTPYRSGERAGPAGRAGFGQLLRAEWTKFRTVRGWVVGVVAAALVTVLVGLLSAGGSHRVCGGPDGDRPCPSTPRGPGGESVSDHFFFVHRTLAGDGGITVRITALTGGSGGLQPWAKAGVIVKDGTTPGSAYAAVLATGGHGVRMQDEYVHDTAGLPGAVSAGSPRWLRLTRAGDTLTGYDSADGTHWTRIGTARLAGLPATVQIGMFAASPDSVRLSSQGFGSSNATGGPTQATAVLDQVALQGAGSGAWTGTDTGGNGPAGTGAGPGAVGVGQGPAAQGTPDGFRQQAADSFTLRGSGDIAPAVGGPLGDGQSVERSLVGVFAGLVVMIVVGTLFMTTEYRRGLIRTTLTVSPRRGRVLAAKAVVAGSVGFAAGLVAAAVAVPLCLSVLRANGNEIYPVGFGTELRVVVGTAALLGVVTVLALAVGTVLRRGAGAVALVVALTVLPYILATAGVLPAGPSEWLLRLTPAAGFAVQQTLPQYAQVSSVYTPSFGYYPLAPWAGFAVLCGWTLLALGLAHHLLRRRDV